MTDARNNPTLAENTADPARDARAALVERLFREHNQALLRFLVSKLQSQQEAKDIAQEAYVRLLKLDTPDAVSYLRAFLFKTASNLAIDRLRTRQAETRRTALQHPLINLRHRQRQLDRTKLRYRFELRKHYWLPIFAAPIQRNFTRPLRHQHIFLERGDLPVIQSFLPPIDLFGGRRQHFDDQFGILHVVAFHILRAAGDHDIRIIKDVVPVDFQTHFHAG